MAKPQETRARLIPHAKVTPKEHEALLRLLQVGAGVTGQSRRVADFLVAWWNAGSCGIFDFTTAWGLDSALVEDVIVVFSRNAMRELPRYARVFPAFRKGDGGVAP